jgi:hypothetical protein
MIIPFKFNLLGKYRVNIFKEPENEEEKDPEDEDEDEDE